MKKLFGHLLPLTDVEIDEIWKKGTLTVDTNVLLDLFRSHSETRDAILNAMRGFEGRLWLSHQAASEFMRNYARVALGVEAEFRAAEGDLSELEKAVSTAQSRLGSRRPLSRDVAQKLKADIAAAIRIAKEQVADERGRYSDGLTDEVLKNVLSLFDGCVGSAPVERTNLQKEAERRIKEKVPPGYKDEKKGEHAHGDYFLWHQVLQWAKESARPIILVTSEKKEDWWESAEGKTIGPRCELRDEAHQVAGQRVLIYQTLNFLDHVAKRAGGAVSEIVRSDLRAPRIDLDLADIIATEVEALADKFLDDESPINSLVTNANAEGWRVDWVEVVDIDTFDYSTCSTSFIASLHYCGDQLDGRMSLGTKICAEFHGKIAFEAGSWVVRDDFEICNAKMVDYGLDDDD